MASRRTPGGIVQGQAVAPAKLAFAKQMRSQMTPEEWMLWSNLRRKQCAGLHFRRQQVIAGFVVDFYCDGARLAVELDGAFHDSDADAQRDRALANVGVEVMRFENQEVRNRLAAVLERIAGCARKRMPEFYT